VSIHVFFNCSVTLLYSAGFAIDRDWRRYIATSKKPACHVLVGLLEIFRDHSVLLVYG